MNKEIFVQNVKRLCLEKGIKPTNACTESGVGGSFLSDSVRGQTPSVAKVQMLANYLGVTTSELLGEEKPTPVSGDGNAAIDVIDDDLREYLDELRSRPEKRLLFSVTKNATKSQIEAIVKMVEEMQGGK